MEVSEDGVKSISISSTDEHPVRIQSDPVAGRYLVANRDLKSGDLILEGKPYTVVVLQNYKNTCCNTCYKVFLPLTGKHATKETPDESSPRVCANCKDIWYCSQACQNSDQIYTLHSKPECAAFKKLYGTKIPFDIFAYGQMKLTIRTLCRRFDEKQQSNQNNNTELHQDIFSKEPTYQDVDNLVSNLSTMATSNAEAHKRVMAMAEHITRIMKGSKVLDGIPVTEIAELISKISCNSFGIWNKRLHFAKGLAVYPNCSFFNHSCAPNCVRYQDGISLKMRALHDIPQGTELAISYIEFEDDYITRRAILSEHYFFTCQCIRCTSQDTDEAFNRIKPYMCPVKGCAGLLGINPEKNLPNNTRICSGCGYIQEDGSK